MRPALEAGERSVTLTELLHLFRRGTKSEAQCLNERINMGNETRVEIKAAGDILTARQQGRTLATKLGFPGSDVTLIAAAVSEIARNIIEHAEGGEVRFELVEKGRKRGLQIVARDYGPGIEDVVQAMQYGYSSRNGSGLGLPGAKWLMDDFDIQSKPGEGTTIIMTKWVSRPHTQS